MGAVQGTLENSQFPDLVHSLGRDRESGVLSLTHGEVEKSVYFGGGSMVFARSSLPSDRLGEMLVERGELTRTHLALASNRMRSQKQKLGVTLVSLGLMSERAMRERVEDQIKDIIRSLFTWQQGSFEFQPNEPPPSNDLRLELPTVPILLEGTRLMDPSTVRRALGPIERVVSYSGDPNLLAHHANLTPHEGFVLSRVDGTASLADIVSISPLPEAETLRCLYGLLSSGFVELGQKSRAVAPTNTSSRPAYDILPPSNTSGPQSKPVATPRPRSSTANPEVLETIDAKFAAVSSGTFYDWLEVGRNDDTQCVKRAFSRLIKQFHPDRHGPEVLASSSRKLDTIVAKLTEAYEALLDTSERTRYENSLRSEAPRGEASASTKPAPTPPPSPASHIAERYYLQAQKFFGNGDYHEVVRIMEEAVQLEPGLARYHRLLASAQMKNPRWRRSAEEHFKNALAIDPFDTGSLTGLASLYESVGLKRRAKALYAEAAEIDPDNASARRKRDTLS